MVSDKSIKHLLSLELVELIVASRQSIICRSIYLQSVAKKEIEITPDVMVEIRD
jgi:hypothetical protein